MDDEISRNERIFSERLSGRTLKSIGDEYGISAERIRVICEKFLRKAKDYDRMKERLSSEVKKLKEDIRHFELQASGGTSVDELPLSERTATALRAGNIKTVQQIRLMTNAELLALPNFGRKSLNELREIVSCYDET
jgi:DNA-directed RNA polymerase alpha subunit